MSSLAASTVFAALMPDEASAQRICNYKQQVRRLVGGQLYLADPPHMTLYLAAYPRPQDAVAAAARIAPTLSSPQFSLAGWHTFMADALTGRNTLVLQPEASAIESLRILQSRVVRALSMSRDVVATQARIGHRVDHLSAAEQQSLRDWGFPYVGPIWQPHFTIASINAADWARVAESLLTESANWPVTCARLDLFRLEGNNPVLLESFPVTAHRSLPTADTSKLTAESCDATFKDRLTAALWRVVDRHEWLVSATITGSFLTDTSLRAISDIDLVVVVDQLTKRRFATLQQEFDAALRPILAKRGLGLKINPTLGPLKLNDEATAVLHLMVYTPEGHRSHVIQSPFTCLDWQRSTATHKLSLSEVYPVFGLQPHHFLSGRRGAGDYLRDLDRGVVSYRELVCDDQGHKEVRGEKPMDARDRAEFGYHVMRFLMQNLVKLLTRDNAIQNQGSGADSLCDVFFAQFDQNAAAHRSLYEELCRQKRTGNFTTPVDRHTARLHNFVRDFASQFREIFETTATRHLLIRHAPTRLNGGRGDARRFVGRVEVPIDRPDAPTLAALASAVAEHQPAAVFASPSLRCQQTLDLLRRHMQLAATMIDPRLIEIDYGRCDGLTIGESRRDHPHLFARWDRGEDSSFPEGENSADVLARALEFVEETWRTASGNTVACTHNVVIRCLVGHALGVPRNQWHRITVPHLTPITFVQTRDYGWFVDLDEPAERALFSSFFAARWEATPCSSSSPWPVLGSVSSTPAIASLSH
ncbi:MAG: histidine phosphatase family protein [Planctomycetia bacterium]|nr:histidine phosphatase family protein [Planctomycetia bacterium]